PRRRASRYSSFPYTTLFRSRREDVECTGRLFDFEPHIDQAVIYIVASFNVFCIHLLGYMQLVSECLDCRILARDACTDCIVEMQDRKSTRLNSSHVSISCAV